MTTSPQDPTLPLLACVVGFDLFLGIRAYRGRGPIVSIGGHVEVGGESSKKLSRQTYSVSRWASVLLGDDRK